MDNNAMVIADRSGVIRFWSAGAEAAFGYSAGEAVGQTLDLIVPAEHVEAHWLGFRRAVEAGRAAQDGQVVPFPVRQASGDVVEVPGRLSLVREAQGQVIGAMVVFG